MFAIVDFAWLSLMVPRFYRTELGDIALPSVNIAPAMLFYALYPIGLLIFATMPAVKSGSAVAALSYGALFGFFTYATYDLTNYATLRNWTLSLTLVDIAWGTVLALRHQSPLTWRQADSRQPSTADGRGRRLMQTALASPQLRAAGRWSSPSFLTIIAPKAVALTFDGRTLNRTSIMSVSGASRRSSILALLPLRTSAIADAMPVCSPIRIGLEIASIMLQAASWEAWHFTFSTPFWQAMCPSGLAAMMVVTAWIGALILGHGHRRDTTVLGAALFLSSAACSAPQQISI